MNEVIVSVKCCYGTYTARIGKTRASCTAGERQAVERLAEKLYGKDAAVVLKRLHDIYPGKAEWSIAESEAA